MDYTILAADDEKEILEIFELFLSKEGFRILKAENGQKAIDIFNKEQIDLAILDIMMPGINGIQVLEYIRKKSTIPVIVLSAKKEDYDKIIGLKLGADDYISKPFNPLELVARVEANIRRTYHFNIEKKDDCILKNGALGININEGKVIINNKTIELTATEFKILKLLLSNCGRIFTKKQIFEAVREEEFFDSDNTVMVHISNLRNKIEEDAKHPVYLKTIKGLGYKMDKVTNV
ncbi:response regulator [Anaerocolumna sedimenticola]|uniref:Stage 0 sporulation protein A homolog n=1 Tax=Anaerocolumna sedimenticola TaxID=2696063 RepID=A0A6P1TRP0_9FIRM|nr:response regulator transcription factor [Anaerocolumna sedimenticola]QHQ62912.1 response regulator [Anaerocolumna sedimenticola]